MNLLTLFEEIVNSRRLVRLRELLVYINSYIDEGDESVPVRVIFPSLPVARVGGAGSGGKVVDGRGGRTAGGLVAFIPEASPLRRMCP